MGRVVGPPEEQVLVEGVVGPQGEQVLEEGQDHRVEGLLEDPGEGQDCPAGGPQMEEEDPHPQAVTATEEGGGA